MYQNNLSPGKKKKQIRYESIFKALNTDHIFLLPINDEALCLLDNHETQNPVSDLKQEMMEAVGTDYDTLFKNLDMIQRIEADSKQQEELLHVLAHRLRTDISGVHEWIKRASKAQDFLSPHRISVISDKLWLTHTAINDILNFSMIENNQIESQIKISDFKLCEVVREAVTEVSMFSERSISIPISDDLTMTADRSLIKHALVHLLDNAVKYSTSAGSVQVTADMEKGQMTLAVQSQPMIQVPESELEIVFQKFKRGVNGYKIPGTGLGLYVVDHVAKAHQGNAKACLKKNGEIEFCISIPQYQRDKEVGL